MLERLAEKNVQQVRIIKVDANAHRSWATSEKVKGVPTIHFYKGGMKLDQMVGAYPEKLIQQRIDQYVLVATAPDKTQGKDQPEPTIKPMPKDWLPPGVTRQ